MYWQLNYYALALLIFALTSGEIAVYAWYRRPATCATSLMLIMFGAAEWSLNYLLLLIGTFLLLRTQFLSSYLQRRQSSVILGGISETISV